MESKFDCTLDSEFAVSKLIFNTGYCTLTHDTSCLNNRHVSHNLLFVAYDLSSLCKQKLIMLNTISLQPKRCTHAFSEGLIGTQEIRGGVHLTNLLKLSACHQIT